MWADGRGVVAVAGGVEVEFPSGRVVAKERVEDEKRVVEGAREVYEWLLKHPGPIFLEKEDADAEWNLTPDARFVKGVGWCREVGTGRWSMKFLDGVGLEIGGSEVVWVEPGGGKRRVERGIKDEGVRARVVEFVKAGL